MQKINKGVLSILSLILLFATYYMMFGKYRPAEIDDAWTASYIWSLTHLHSTIDQVFGMPSNFQFFGHIHSYLAGAVADIFGWSKKTFHLFNTLCLTIAAFSWWRIARFLLRQWELALLFVVLTFLLEPFLGAALKGRSDALAFMFISLGTWAAASRRFFIAALLVCLGIEVHPISLIGTGWVLVFVFSFASGLPEWPRSGIKPLAWCLLGAVAGFCLYRYLHPDSLSDILRYLGHSNEQRGSFNALTAHYFTRAYFRFVPELLFLLVGAVFFFRGKKRFNELLEPVSLLFLVTLVLSFVLRRANFHYVIFFYPPFMLAALVGFARTRLFLPAVVLLVAYALTLNGILFWQNRRVDHAAFDQHLASMGIPDDGTPVVGLPNAWFVMRDRKFYASFHALTKEHGACSERVYYIRSAYSPPVPSCVRVAGQVGDPFFFNGGKVDAQILDLRACGEK